MEFRTTNGLEDFREEVGRESTGIIAEDDGSLEEKKGFESEVVGAAKAIVIQETT